MDAEEDAMLARCLDRLPALTTKEAAAREPYERIRERIRALPDDLEPPPGAYERALARLIALGLLPP